MTGIIESERYKSWRMFMENKVKFDKDRIIELLKKSFIDIENDDSITVDEKVNTIIHTTSTVCAMIAIQPIPFADALILTPIQMAMILHMTNIIRKDALKKEKNDNKEFCYDKKSLEPANILTTIAAATGVGLAAQQGIIGLYKTVIPFLSAITTIPMVYATTFAIGSVAKKIIDARLRGEEIDKAYIRRQFKESLKIKEKELKEKDDLNDFLVEEVDKLEKENKVIKSENFRLSQALSNLNEKIQNEYDKKNSKIFLVEDNQMIQNMIYEAIDFATKNICISIYDISDYSLMEKLENASSRGIKIEIIADYRKINDNLSQSFDASSSSSQSHYTYKTINRMKKCFRQKNITVKLFGKYSEGINHQKDIIIDEVYLISGSANFTKRAFNHNKETVFCVNDSDLVTQRLTLFRSLFDSKNVVLLDKKLLE